MSENLRKMLDKGMDKWEIDREVWRLLTTISGDIDQTRRDATMLARETEERQSWLVAGEDGKGPRVKPLVRGGQRGSGPINRAFVQESRQPP
jgi:hypothetical protein